MSQVIPSYLDVIKYVLKNRRGTNSFMGWSIRDIYHTTNVASANDLCFVCADPGGRVSGIVVAQIAKKPNTIEITNILCSNKEALRCIISKYHEHWSGYNIIAERKGKMLIYRDTRKLIEKLSHTTTYG